jgi:predicted GIY-YIG superfamily endonuclease
MGFWVYILANRRGGTLYVGVTNDLVRRAFEHREGLVPGFTKRYGIKMLVYYTTRPPLQSSGKRTSSTGRASGRSISFSR